MLRRNRGRVRAATRAAPRRRAPRPATPTPPRPGRCAPAARQNTATSRHRSILPSPPFRGEREGPTPEAWEGEVGVGERSGIPHLTPTLSPPRVEREMAGGPITRQPPRTVK